MSQVISNKRNKINDVKHYFLISILLLIGTIVVVLLISEFGNNPTPLVFIPMILLGIPSLYNILEYSKRRKIKVSENKMYKDLVSLSEQYTLINDVYVPFEGRILECKQVVIGRNGVFIVQACPSKGYIYESNYDKYWVCYKTKNTNSFFKKTIYNPTKLLDMKVLALAKYLKKYNIYTWIQGVVYFTNKKVELNLNTYAPKVFSKQEELLEYISKFPPKREIDDLKKEKIIKLLTLDRKFT